MTRFIYLLLFKYYYFSFLFSWKISIFISFFCYKYINGILFMIVLATGLHIIWLLVKFLLFLTLRFFLICLLVLLLFLIFFRIGFLNFYWHIIWLFIIVIIIILVVIIDCYIMIWLGVFSIACMVAVMFI